MNRRMTLGWIVGCVVCAAVAAPGLRAQDAAGEEAWRKLIEPSRVTLDLKEATWLEAYQKLAEVSGNTLNLPKGKTLGAKPVTIAIQDEPFWKAVALLKKAAPAALNPAHGTGGLDVEYYDEAVEYPIVEYVGPAEVCVRTFDALREADYNWDFSEGRSHRRGPSVQLSIGVSVEPRVSIAAGVIQLDKAEDDTGKDLLVQPGGARGGLATVHVSSARDAVREYVRVPIALPAANATRLKLVRGTLRLDIVPPAEPLRLALDKPGQEITLVGNPVTYLKADGDETRGWEVTFKAASWPRGSRVDDSLRGAKLADAEGKTLSFKGFGTHRGGAKPGGAAPALGDAAEVRFKFEWQPDFKPAVLIVPPVVPPRSQEFPIEFADIPLPPLTAAYASNKTSAAAAVPDAPMPPAPDTVLPIEKLAASTFTLDAADMPLADVAAEIARQTGNPVVAQKVSTRRDFAAPTVTGKFDKVEFWRGLQDICRSGAISLNYSGFERNRQVDLGKRVPTTGEQFSPGSSQIIGAVRYSLTRVAVRAESKAEYYSKPFLSDKFELSVTVNAWVEPKIQIVRQAGHLLQCFTAGGEDLVTRLADPARTDVPAYQRRPPVPDWRAVSMVDSTQNSVDNIRLTVPLTSGEVPQSLARVRAYHYVMVGDKSKAPGPDRVFEWKEFAPGTVYDVGSGLKVTCEQVKSANDGFVLRFVPTREGGVIGDDMDLLEKGFKAFDTDGKALTVFGDRRATGDNPGMALILWEVPAKATLTVPASSGVYAGVVEFRDIPVPALPAWEEAN